jgi:adenylate kinase family enzyme
VLAERISRVTGTPWHSVDELPWEPGWVPVAEHEQRRRIEAICATDRWVLDTAYGTWLEIPLARAEMIVAIDFPRWLSLIRLLRRTVARAVDGQAICNGNRQSFRQAFSRQSIVLWHFKSFSQKRRRIREWEIDPAAPTVVCLTSPREVETWLTDPLVR